MDLDKILKKDSGYQVQRVGDILQVIPENEFEAKEMNVNEIAKAIENKTHAMSKKNPKIQSAKQNVQRSNASLKKILGPYYEDLKELQLTKNSNSRAYMKYKQALEYMYIFFGEKTLVTNITTDDVREFQKFLIAVPSDYKNKKPLQGKSIKLLIEKKSPLLKQFPRNKGRTIDEVIVKCKHYFEQLRKKKFIPENTFEEAELMVLGDKKASDRREFKEYELQEVFTVLKKQDYEYTNLIKFLLYTGFRRGEALELRVEDIDISKPYIDTDGNKTINAKRVVPIHKDIFEMIKLQMVGKDRTDYLFFDDRKYLKTRVETIGTDLNGFIKEAIIRLTPEDGNNKEERLKVIEDKKKQLDLHSLRKNYAQEVFLSNVLSDMNLKSLVGHALDKNNVTDNNYLRGKRDFKTLKESIDKVDFAKYLPTLEDVKLDF